MLAIQMRIWVFCCHISSDLFTVSVLAFDLPLVLSFATVVLLAASTISGISIGFASRFAFDLVELYSMRHVKWTTSDFTA